MWTYCKGGILILTIKVIDVSAGYRGRTVVDHINAVFSNRVLLLGPNGAGKTTLFRAIAGIADIYSGTILIDGINVNKASAMTRLLALNLPEAYRLLPIDCYRLLRLYMDIMDGDFDYALNIIENFGLSRQRLREKKLWELSAGQQKVFTTVATIASKSRNMLFDEPLEQLDPSKKVKLLSILTSIEGPNTIIVATHETWFMNRLAEWSAYIMFRGKIVGPLPARDLAEMRIVKGYYRDAIATINTEMGKISLVPPGVGEGKPLTDLISLDKLYEMLI